ncbi:Ger(x)C family spore germination protein [Paenibacillus pasadenensis]|uniref:Ger(x)C family spore germination protein n=1 Tax=Paenibacillus pasadenensis TaxID=217090 RepID=UPI0020401583|nr:Ger(x)C family spore germination protein [Paenibacillus pasadenensis]MCM3749183.1 Ger(x)C family spore germination protein [Paenibacillus pasadenensis]
MRPFRRVRQLAAISLSACMLVTSSGCWDSRDVDNRMLVGSIGIEDIDDENLKVWFRVPITSSTSSNDKDSSFTASARGVTVMDAINRVQYKLSKSLDVSSTRAVLMNMKTARVGLLPYLEFAIRDRSVPLDAVVAIIDGDMAPLFTRKNPIGELSGIYTKLYFEPYAGGIPRKNKTTLWEIYSKFLNPTHANLVPVLKDDKESLFTQIGNAYFNGDKYAGMITMDESLIYEMITERLADTEIMLMSRSDIKVVHKKTKVHTKLENGKPIINVVIWVAISLTDKSQNKGVTTEEDIKRELDGELHRLARSLTKKTQKAGTDIVGFGNRFRGRMHPNDYDKWPDMYRNAEINYKFHIRLRNSGLEFLEQ